jgi:hypothetical protein
MATVKLDVDRSSPVKASWYAKAVQGREDRQYRTDVLNAPGPNNPESDTLKNHQWRMK